MTPSAPIPDTPADRGCPVVVVDDDAGVRESMRVLLQTLGYDIRLYGNGASFLDAEDGTSPFCLILDLRMAPMSGFDVFKRVRTFPVKIPAIFLTGHGDIPMAVDAMRLGALDFLEKPADPQRLIEGITRAQSVFAAATATDAHANGPEPDPALSTLTKREQEVLDLLVTGMTNKAIAHALSISIRTVEVHRSRVKEKLAARNLADLMRYAKS